MKLINSISRLARRLGEINESLAVVPSEESRGKIKGPQGVLKQGPDMGGKAEIEALAAIKGGDPLEANLQMALIELDKAFEDL